jgi:hypothetical protein
MAMAIRTQAGVFLVTQTSLKARNAAINCKKIDAVRIIIVTMVIYFKSYFLWPLSNNDLQ